MMSGLRSQRERIMTWVSLRSGIASNGRRVADHAPQKQLAATRAKIRNLFLIEKSMIRLIIRASMRARNFREVAYLRSCVCMLDRNLLVLFSGFFRAGCGTRRMGFFC